MELAFSPSRGDKWRIPAKNGPIQRGNVSGITKGERIEKGMSLPMRRAKRDSAYPSASSLGLAGLVATEQDCLLVRVMAKSAGAGAGMAIMGEIAETRLFDHIGRIYDCVLFPDRWQSMVEAIKEDFRWHNAVLGVYSFLNSGANLKVTLGVPVEYLGFHDDPSYLPDVFKLWGGMERIEAAPLEEPVLLSQMGYPETWKDNRFFTAYAMPQGIFDVVSVALERDTSMIATLSGGRHVSRGPITENELYGLRILAPHLRRAVTLANLFDNLLAQNHIFSETLETSRAGIILVDESLTILHANGLARQLLDSGNPTQATNGRLVLREPLSQRALVAAVSANSPLVSARAAGIPTMKTDGSILMIHTFPLKRPHIRQNFGVRASSALILAASPEPLDINNEALALLYNLTPAETRIVNMASEGLTMAEIAKGLGIASSTVKTHLLRIYEKTGTHRRVELIRLLRSISGHW